MVARGNYSSLRLLVVNIMSAWRYFEVGLGAVVMASGSIDVILPTYNGVRFLREQVASIAQQTMRPRMLLVRDDGSTDGTQELIRELIGVYGAWLKVLPGDENLGCTGNVNQLLEATSAPYVALADQDDVWLPNKLEIAYQELCAVESVHGPHAPALVHTDLKLVDANLNDLGTTYLQKQRLHPSWVSPSEIALTNIVTGCTVMCNRPLLDCALPFPQRRLFMTGGWLLWQAYLDAFAFILRLRFCIDSMLLIPLVLLALAGTIGGSV